MGANRIEASAPTCRICAGTGRQLVMRSWFTADGFRFIRCAICAGTGHSRYRNAEAERSQRRLRAKAASLPTPSTETGGHDGR